MKFNYAININDLYFFFQVFCMSLKYLTSQKSKIPLSIYVLYRNFSTIELYTIIREEEELYATYSNLLQIKEEIFYFHLCSHTKLQ